MCPAWKGPSIFPALHMLGDGKPSQKPGHSTRTQTPSPDHVFKSVPAVLIPTLVPQISIVFHLADPPLFSPYQIGLSGTQIGSQCSPAKHWLAKTCAIGFYLHLERPWP